MAVRQGLIPVIAGTLAVATAYGSAFLPGGAPGWASWSMVVGIALLFTGTMALGAARPGRRLGPMVWALAFAFVVLVGCFGAALALPSGEGPGSRLLLGLPLRAALVVYGIGWLPVLVLPVVYARTFRNLTLDESDLERIRAARRPGEAP
jgi:hypothetical protein